MIDFSRDTPLPWLWVVSHDKHILHHPTPGVRDTVLVSSLSKNQGALERILLPELILELLLILELRNKQ